MAIDDGLRPIDCVAYERKSYPPDDNFINFAKNWQHYKDRLVIFLGAGASVGAQSCCEAKPFPTAFHLRNGIWQRFMVAQGSKLQPEHLGLMSLEHAAALVERSAGRDALLRHIVDCFETKAPLWHHAVLPYLKPKAVFTTNYDTLIEDGWALHGTSDGVGRLCVYYKDETPTADGSVPLFKPHGSAGKASSRVGEGGIVITQFDYNQMLGKRRAALERCLGSLGIACVLFIGYSFQDLDVTSTLHEMRNPNDRRSIPWYAVFPRNDSNVRGMYEEQFGIRQINRTFFDFMADLDDMLNFISDGWKVAQIHSIHGILKS